MLSLPVRCFMAKLPDEHHFSFGNGYRAIFAGALEKVNVYPWDILR